MMASTIKPAIIRQACLSTGARRAFTQVSRTSGSMKTATSTPRNRAIFSRNNPTQPLLLRNAYPPAARIAAFHASSRKAILPAEPQVIHGTVNDPAPVPPPSPTHGSYHWTFERLLSVALVPLTIAPFAAGTLHPITDAVLCATIVIHSHIGFQSIIIDYIPSRRLPKTRKLFMWGLNAGTLVVGVGLYEFETNDVGLTEAIKRIWTA